MAAAGTFLIMPPSGLATSRLLCPRHTSRRCKYLNFFFLESLCHYFRIYWNDLCTETNSSGSEGTEYIITCNSPVEGRYITVQRKNANSAINLAEVVQVLTVPHAPNMLTVMKWNDVQEEDLSQECPDTHPFAFLDVRS